MTDVVLLRWPAEETRRELLREAGEARLLLVENGTEAPPPGDCLEDWVRVPASDGEMQARLEALSLRSRAHDSSSPDVDGDGVLRYRGQWVSLAPLEARLTAALLARFGAVASRETLIRTLWPGKSPGRNALDVHVLRLRRRLAPLGLAIRTVRSRGYLLEASGAHVNGVEVPSA